MYGRVVEDWNEHLEELALQRHELEQEELNSSSHRPEITQRAHRLGQRRSRPEQRFAVWEETRRAKLEQCRLRKEQADLQECVFEPAINLRSRRLNSARARNALDFLPGASLSNSASSACSPVTAASPRRRSTLGSEGSRQLSEIGHQFGESEKLSHRKSCMKGRASISGSMDGTSPAAPAKARKAPPPPPLARAQFLPMTSLTDVPGLHAMFTPSQAAQAPAPRSARAPSGQAEKSVDKWSGAKWSVDMDVNSGAHAHKNVVPLRSGFKDVIVRCGGP